MRSLSINFSTFRKGGPGRRWLFLQLLTGIALVCSVMPGHAIDPDRPISQYDRQRWETDKGFQGGAVSAIAQTPDGYLWIGTARGLVRFDGLNFQLFRNAVPSSLPIGPVQKLMADEDGNLWIVLQSTQILRYRDGRFELGREEAEFGITSISRRRDGTVLLSSLAFGTLVYRAGRYQILTSPSGFSHAETTATAEADTRNTRLSWASGFRPQRFADPNSAVTAMTETTDGRVWLGTRDKGLFYISQGRVFAASNGLPIGQINCLLTFPNEELWIGTDTGMEHWNGTGLSSSGVPEALRHIRILSMIRDRDSNIWVGTNRGLVRVSSIGNFPGVSTIPANDGPVTALFEDREGNIWTGGAQGLERLRDSAFVTNSIDGLHSQTTGAVYVDSGGRTWVAPIDGGLRWLSGEMEGSVAAGGLNNDVVYSIAGGGNNELWLGRLRGGLTDLRYVKGSFTAKTYTQADGLAQNSVYAVYRSRDGTIWAATLSAGVSALRDGHFTTYTIANGLASNTVASIAEGSDGTMWFGTPDGVSALSSNGWRTYAVRHGLRSPDVNCLLVDSMGILWIGTADGLAFLRDGKVQVPRTLPDFLHEPIFGIAEDQSGELWVATASRILQVKGSRLVDDILNESDYREYGLADGLQGTEGVKRFRSVVSDAKGQIWFSTNRGLSLVNPSRGTDNSPPALVHIEAVSADGTPFDLRKPITIPHGKEKTTFRFVGLSLKDSERVRYRYRLDGFDHSWSEAGTDREATYGNLRPGTYRFRVLASNSDRIWNGAEASVGFKVEPVFWQTWWFRLTAVTCVGLATLFVYRLRTRRLTQLLSIRFEERLAERARVAQELHDTLLQGVISASMQLHVAVEGMSQESPVRPTLSHVLAVMGRVIEEGRITLRGLRSSIDSANDLQASFSRIPQELGVSASDFRVVVEGDSTPLRAAVRDDIYLIGREAVVNAFRHSGARNVDLRLVYGVDQLRISVQDNGRRYGGDAKTPKAAHTGDWRMSGMR
jgi:ligand-binding sensor domain-containing protein